MKTETIEETSVETEAQLTHAFYGKVVNGKFMKTNLVALCGFRSKTLGELATEVDDNMCQICLALYQNQSLWM